MLVSRPAPILQNSLPTQFHRRIDENHGVAGRSPTRFQQQRRVQNNDVCIFWCLFKLRRYFFVNSRVHNPIQRLSSMTVFRTCPKDQPRHLLPVDGSRGIQYCGPKGSHEVIPNVSSSQDIMPNLVGVDNEQA